MARKVIGPTSSRPRSLIMAVFPPHSGGFGVWIPALCRPRRLSRHWPIEPLNVTVHEPARKITGVIGRQGSLQSCLARPMHLDRLGVAGREDRGTGADVGAGVEYLFEGQANCWKVGASALHEAETPPIPSRDPVPREPHRLLRRLR